MKKFTKLVKESNDFYEKFDNVSDDIKDLINKTIDSSGGEYSMFLDKYVKDSDVKIEGLINDSDVYDFYLKYTDDIDTILNDIKFYDETPSSKNAFGLYSYLVTGTNEAISEVVKNLYELDKSSEKED